MADAVIRVAAADAQQAERALIDAFVPPPPGYDAQYVQATDHGPEWELSVVDADTTDVLNVMAEAGITVLQE